MKQPQDPVTKNHRKFTPTDPKLILMDIFELITHVLKYGIKSKNRNLFTARPSITLNQQF